jgi:hypothetical protein
MPKAKGQQPKAIFYLDLLLFDLLLEVFLAPLFLAGLFFAVGDLRPLLGEGTFAPFSLASDNPIAIACLRLVTFLPDRPDVN